MTFQPPRTYTPPIRTYVGDDAFISAELDRESEYSTDLRIRGAKHNTVTTLHLSPAAVRDLRDTLTRCLMALESEAIIAAAAPAQEYPTGTNGWWAEQGNPDPFGHGEPADVAALAKKLQS